MGVLSLRVSYKEILETYLNKWHEYPDEKGNYFHIQTLEMADSNTYSTKGDKVTDQYCFFGDQYLGKTIDRPIGIVATALLLVINIVPKPEGIV